MKKGMIFFGLMMVSAVMFAQRTADPAQRSARLSENMKVELGLDEVQFNAIKAINDEYAQKMALIRLDSTQSKETKRDQITALHRERETALKNVLTDEQHKKLVANRSNHVKKFRAKRAKHQGDYANTMQKELSLTEEQAAKLKTINREFSQKFRALRSDSTIAREDNKAKVKKLREEYQLKTKSVLTEEQVKKWENLKSERKRRRL